MCLWQCFSEMHVIKKFERERRCTGNLNLEYLFLFENMCFLSQETETIFCWEKCPNKATSKSYLCEDLSGLGREVVVVSFVEKNPFHVVIFQFVSCCALWNLARLKFYFDCSNSYLCFAYNIYFCVCVCGSLTLRLTMLTNMIRSVHMSTW